MPTTYTRDSPPADYRKRIGREGDRRHAGFRSGRGATKTEVKQAVETLFKVKVHGVRTANFVGKERRRGKFTGFRPDWKKAYVRLKAGEKMPDYVNNL